MLFRSNWKTGIDAIESAYTDITAENTVVGQSPGFVNMAEMDFRLLPESACIDAGTSLHPNVLPAHNVIYQYVKHQSGEERPVDEVPDIGAFEFMDEISGINSKIPKKTLCQVYPNPATDVLFVKVESYHTSKYFYQLFDLNGKVVQNRVFEEKETVIHVGHLKPAAYILNIYSIEENVKLGGIASGRIQPRLLNSIKIIKQ